MVHMSSIVVSNGQVSCDLDEEAVILDMESGTYFGLDPVGTAIWKLIQVPIRVEEIRNQLVERYDVDGERCTQDLLALLEDLIREGLARLELPLRLGHDAVGGTGGRRSHRPRSRFRQP